MGRNVTRSRRGGPAGITTRGGNSMQALDITSYQTLTQDRPHHDTSDRYSFIPTSRALATLAGIGWQPVSVTERSTRKEDHRGFQTHLVRLRKADRLTQT